MEREDREGVDRLIDRDDREGEERLNDRDDRDDDRLILREALELRPKDRLDDRA